MKTLVKEEVDQIRNVLSPEQLPKVKAILEERKEAKEESLAQSIASLKDLDLTEAEVAKIGEIKNEDRGEDRRGSEAIGQSSERYAKDGSRRSNQGR